MEVVVGPVPTGSMGAFVRFARGVLHASRPGADVPSDAASAFDGYLDQWSAAADGGRGEITWTTDIDPEVAEYLVYAFYRVTKEVTDEAGQQRVVPDDAAPFYWLLVAAILDALHDEGGSRAEFADHLREFWPGDHEVPPRS